MPPVVRVATPVNFSNEPTFGHFSDINSKGNDDENVHSNDAWNENLKRNESSSQSDLKIFQNQWKTHVDHRVFLTAHFEIPMNCGYNTESSPWHEHCYLDIVLNFESWNLHYHWDHEDHDNCSNVKVPKDLNKIILSINSCCVFKFAMNLRCGTKKRNKFR